MRCVPTLPGAMRLLSALDTRMKGTMAKKYEPMMMRNTKTYTRPMLAMVCDLVMAENAYNARTRTKNMGVTVDMHVSKDVQYCCHNVTISSSDDGKAAFMWRVAAATCPHVQSTERRKRGGGRGVRAMCEEEIVGA